jgi:CheY-like chemotaxis protein
MNSEVTVYDADVFALTDKGSEELQGGLTRLPSIALELLVALDGKLSFAEAAGRDKARSVEEMRRTAQMLLKGGYIRPATVAEEMNIDFSYFFNADAPAAEPSDEHHEEADKGTAALKLDGYYVSIARKAAAPVPPVNGAVYSVLVVEDNVELQGNLKRLLRLEGFEVRQALDRDEILGQLRMSPLPDVILLDVNLPGANGFDVLARIRQHPQLKGMPVIMFTALASRDNVVRGLVGGANGYITKPYEREALLSGIKAVLGLHASASVTVQKPYGLKK